MTARFTGPRGLLLAGLSISVLLAGCLGGRRGAPSPPSAPEPSAGAPVDSANADSAAAQTPPGAASDSGATPAADSAAADSLAPDSLVSDSLAQALALADSLLADSLRADSVRTAAANAKPDTRECILDFTESPPESRLVTNLLNDGSRTTFIGGGVVARCQGDPQVVSADSAEQYETAGMIVLIGNVVFEEPGEVRLTAPTASYFTGEEKLVAYGGVTVTELATGSTFTGPTMEYYRAGDRRPFSRLYAPQRPTARLVEKDSLGNERPPITVTANQMEDVGDTVLVAWGDVTINRESIVGRGDSSTFDKRTESARLIRNAVIFSRDSTQSFRLAGDSIDMFSTNRVLDRVVAMHQATATSNEVTMRAERVEMTLDSGNVDRAWAYGPGRSFAETSTQALEADSITVFMPAQLVETLHAIGAAQAIATPDTLRIRSDEQDILRGDTIIAQFDTATTPPDTSPRSTIRGVIATLRASAWYQLASSRGPDCPPGINYVRGHRIVVAFDSGSVQTVDVDSQATGLYLEPVPDSLGDSVQVTCGLRRDSLAVDTAFVDTLAPPLAPPIVPPDTGMVAVRPRRPGAVPPAREPRGRPRSFAWLPARVRSNGLPDTAVAGSPLAFLWAQRPDVGIVPVSSWRPTPAEGAHRSAQPILPYR